MHLQKALVEKETIPTPDVIEIDEDIYNKLYPVTSKVRHRLIRTIREFRIIFHKADCA